jgi:hypothetical protein
MTPTTLIKLIEEIFKHRLFHWQSPFDWHGIASPTRVAVTTAAVAIPAAR